MRWSHRKSHPSRDPKDDETPAKHETLSDGCSRQEGCRIFVAKMEHRVLEGKRVSVAGAEDGEGWAGVWSCRTTAWSCMNRGSWLPPLSDPGVPPQPHPDLPSCTPVPSWVFFFFLLLLLFLAAQQHAEFLGQGSDLSHSCDLCHSGSNPGSLNPLSWAGDQTCVPALQRRHLSRCATAGMPSFPVLLIQELGGVPVVEQQKRMRRISMRMWVRSLASLSGLEIWRCCELWCRLQTRSRSYLRLWCRPAATAPI